MFENQMKKKRVAMKANHFVAIGWLMFWLVMFLRVMS